MKAQARHGKDKTKRQKISVACDDCRARKVRCDGAQPSVCRDRALGRQPVLIRNSLWALQQEVRSWQPMRLYWRVGKEASNADVSEGYQTAARLTIDFIPSYISTLEDRIKQLESSLVSERASLSEGSPVGYHDSSWKYTGTILWLICLQHTALPSFSPAATYPRPPTVFVQKSQCQPQVNTAGLGGDGVNAMMGAVEEGRLNQGFFGSSSAAGFIKQIKTAVDQRMLSPKMLSSAPDIASRSSFLSVPSEKPLSEVSNYVLPPRRIADDLMDVYWDYVFPLYPFVDSTHMKDEYSKIWHGDTLQRDEHMAMCTFNVVFALSCQLADFIPAEERESWADAYFSRAKDLFQFNLWDTGSAGLIQCLLLMAQYLQSTNSAHQCWIVTGLAIRNAQSLGLHLPQTIAQLHSFQEKQLARKLWHGCVLMDR